MVNYYRHLDTFLFEKEANGLSKATIINYRLSVNKFLTVVGDDVSKAGYYQFINSLNMKGESKKHYAREVRVFLYWLMGEGIIKEFKVSLPKSQEPLPRIPSRETVQFLLNTSTKTFSDHRMWIIVNLVVSTGIRARTITNLMVDDFSYKERQLLLRETKSKRSSVIPLTDDLTMLIYKYIRKYDLKDYLFPTRNGKQLTTEGLETAFCRYADKKNVDCHSIHSLRHYFATEATRNGMSPFVLQKVLGHSDIKVTMKYVNLVNDDVRNEMNQFCPLKNSRA